MRRLAAVALLLGSAAVAFLAAPSVRGQTATGTATVTPTATPTVTPTATTTPPSAAALLTEATNAATAAGSAHIKLVGQVTATGKTPATISASMEGDVAWTKPERGHLEGPVSISTTSSGVTSSYSSPIEVLFKGNKLALRAAQGKWECSNASSVSTPTGTTVPTTTSTSAVHWKSAVLVGPDTVNGVPVWHVQQTGTDVVKGSKNQKTTEHFTGDYYIAQSDSTLTRASASIKSGTAKNGVVESGTVDLSSYREPVKITMPSACAKAKGKKSALLVAIAPAQLIKNPALMFDVLRRLAR